MSDKSYDCPHCGAMDSTRCAFVLRDDGTLKKPEEARAVGCRVMHYTDQKVSAA